MLIFDLDYLEFSRYPLNIVGGSFSFMDGDSVFDSVVIPNVGSAQYGGGYTTEANGFLGASGSGQTSGYIVQTATGIGTGSSTSSSATAE
jgi:hypothetical protein